MTPPVSRNANRIELLQPPLRPVHFSEDRPRVHQLPHISEAFALGYRLMRMQEGLDRIDALLDRISELLKQSQPIKKPGALLINFDVVEDSDGRLMRPYPYVVISRTKTWNPWKRLPVANLARRPKTSGDFTHNLYATKLLIHHAHKLLSKRAMYMDAIDRFKKAISGIEKNLDTIEADTLATFKEVETFIEPIPPSPPRAPRTRR
ncbi:hypothetical protein [Chitinilyticum aquatile]|uniref:hypothetical protein n=1 Tax=Chitinilyticum aquatile TaxID=362520 RepID=UPI000553A1A0|nr:hypothetical protein [Chitinilyticum aquatile]